MRESVERFLVESQRKVVDHYQEVLRSRSIPEPERQAIKHKLDRAEADLRAAHSPRHAWSEGTARLFQAA